MLCDRPLVRLHRMPRILVALVTLAFSIASTVYIAHAHDASKKTTVASDCSVCLQLSGTASPPPPIALIAFVPLVTVEVAFRCSQFCFPARLPRAHRSRAPPARAL